MDVKTYLRKDNITNLINEGKRIDGRAFDEIRKLQIEKGYVSEKAEGSALVKLGDTQVLAGISMDVGEPYPDSPKEGVITTSSEFRPMASPIFESGPPGEESIELARVVDRGIRESGAIDLDKLFIEDELVWVVFIDVHVLDHCGNLIDTSGIAAIAALLNARFPKYEDGKVIRGEWGDKLPIKCVPIPSTFAKISDKLVLDPVLDEEYAMDARLTISTTDTINAMQKGGVGSLTNEEIKSAIDMTFKNAEKLRKQVEA